MDARNVAIVSGIILCPKFSGNAIDQAFHDVPAIANIIGNKRYGAKAV